MKTIPGFYEHPDKPELFGKAATIAIIVFIPLYLALVIIILATFCSDKASYAALALLMLIPMILGWIVGRRKIEEMYNVAVTKGDEEADKIFGKAIVSVQACNIIAIAILVVSVLLIML